MKKLLFLIINLNDRIDENIRIEKNFRKGWMVSP
jgi:hypothetical protein